MRKENIMRKVSKLATLGAIAAGAAMPVAASAHDGHGRDAVRSHDATAVTRLFFDGARESNSETGFTSTSNVFMGSRAMHGPKVGVATLSCTFVSDSKALCNGAIDIFAPGTTTVASSVFFNNVIIAPEQTVFPIQGGTGSWAGVHGVAIVRPVSEHASNVVLRLES
jgi:hypothetical protein